MNLETKICQVQSIFSQLDQEIEELKHSSGLDCRSHCTHCCENPDIEATILEFLPLAKHIYDLGWHERYLHQLAAKPEQCILLNPEQKASQDISLVPGCRMYPYRGIICRLFGFSTREDKFGNPELVACSWLKHAPAYANIFLLGIKIPTIAEYRWQVYGIDPRLCDVMYPINEAIRRAIEIVITYFWYNNPPNSVAS